MANEQQLRALEQRVEGMVRDMRTMWQQIKAALQQVRGAYSNGPTNQGSSGGGHVLLRPSGSIAAASGCAGRRRARAGPYDGQRLQDARAAPTCWWLAAQASTTRCSSATTAGRVLAVCANGDGTYSAASQSCS